MEIADMYEEMFGEGLNFEHAAFYDSCMLVGLSVLQAQTVHPLDLLDVIPMVGEGYLGLTGYCLLDGYGDRLSYQADIVAITDEELVWRKIGEYYSPEGIVVLSK